MSEFKDLEIEFIKLSKHIKNKVCTITLSKLSDINNLKDNIGKDFQTLENSLNNYIQEHYSTEDYLLIKDGHGSTAHENLKNYRAQLHQQKLYNEFLDLISEKLKTLEEGCSE